MVMLPISTGRAPHGARGLKRQRLIAEPQIDVGRAPHGARGLKQQQFETAMGL